MDGLKAAGQPKERKSEYTVVHPKAPDAEHGLVDSEPAGSTPKEQAPDHVTVAIARSFQEIGSLRAVWQMMQDEQPLPKPNADIDRYCSVVEAIEGRVEPYVMLFRRDNQPVAMVIGRTEDHRLSLKLGYQSLFRPRLKCLNIVYGGILGQMQGDLCSIIIDELSRQLKSRQFDAVCFNYLNTDTAFYEAVRKKPGVLIRGHFPTISKHWRMSVPAKMDQFYESRSRRHRGSLRRAVRSFERQYSSRDNFVRYTSEDEVDDFVRLAAGMSSKTYQYALGAGIVNDGQTISRLRTAAKHGWFHGSVLFAGGKPCAFQLGLRYKQVYYLVNLGYDPALNKYRVGTNLFLKVLESLCEDPEIHSLDFYFGDAEYKKRYGTEHWSEACIYMFAPRIYPMAVNMVRCSVAGVNAGLAFVTKKIGGTDRIKRKWRDLLRNSARMSQTEAESGVT